ncbi:MAG: histidinol dehydrogenase, partial [Candidatus Bathyarchaeia archaeon]
MKVLTSKTFEENFLPEILGRSKIQVSKVSRKVEKIIRDVKEKGDLALLYYTKKFDCSNFTIEKLRVSEEEIKDAYKKLKDEELKAL